MRILHILLLATFTLGCSSVSHLQKKGSMKPKQYRESMPFTTYKSVIVLPVATSEGTKNFLFDTGAQLNLIQSEASNRKRTTTVGGASDREMELQREAVKSLKIAEVEFVNSLLSTAFRKAQERGTR